MENSRLLLAALLSVVVLIGWQALLGTLRPPEELPEPPVTEGGPVDPEFPGQGFPADPNESAGALETADEAPEAAEMIDFSADEVAALEESRVVLEAAGMRAEFTNRGAQLTSLRLLNDLDADGQPLEMVRPRGTDPYPFAMVVGGERSHPLNKALFEWTEGTGENGLPLLRFEHRSQRGGAKKVFGVTEDGLLAVEVEVSGATNWGWVRGPGAGQMAADEMESRLAARQAAWRRGKESDTIQPGDPEEDIHVPVGGLDWVALEDNFFITAAIPGNGWRDVVIRPVMQRAEAREGEPRFLPGDTQREEEGLIPELLVLLESGGQRMELLTFFGSKKYSRLTALPYGLEPTVRWGSFIGIFARPLYFALEWIHRQMVPNYGWAIVLVTCLIKVLFFPLTWKSQMSMSKMQELNPKIQAIRSKYRSKLKDRQGRPNVEAQRALNDEIMKVYKKAGVNPVSGCFPMLLQMPVFFALFRLLSTAVELRGAPWHLWIRDLSAPDPYFILPLVMGATSIAMQKMMPQAPDPMQRRMMQMMPIMFSIFALYFPSGLVLYWVTNNLLTMVQQAVMNRIRGRDSAGRVVKSEA